MCIRDRYIGAQDTGSLIREFTGYLDEIRISTVERYGNFTPPTALFEADANTKLLIQSQFSEGGLGADHSGNYNYFTPTNLAVYDMMIDSPMNSTGGNWCTMNPLDTDIVSSVVISEGNLEYNTGSSNYGSGRGTMYTLSLIHI